MDRIDPIPSGWAPDPIDRVVPHEDRDRDRPGDRRDRSRRRPVVPHRGPTGPTVGDDGAVHIDVEA